MLHWYALNSKPHCEKFVQEGLLARGMEAYLPLWRPPQPRGSSPLLRPFFPNYLFARADLEVVGLSGLKYIPGLRRVVFCGNQPAPVAQIVIDEIRRRLVEIEQSVVDAEGRPLRRGDRVEITGGPLAGLEAVFDERLDSGQRVRVLVDFLRKQARYELEAGLIRKKPSPFPRRLTLTGT
jgi:transcriptional antiterminator RfaH